jgi:hypothetical protein
MLIKIKNMVLASVCIMMLLKPLVGDAQFVKKLKGSKMIDPKNFRELVVRPALDELNLWSKEAEELLMLTAAVETELGTFLKQGFKKINDHRGIGRGVFSMEPETFLWLRSIPMYEKMLYGTPNDLITDLKLAAKAARLRYRVVPTKLPAHDDIEGLAEYWNKWYNGNPKVGTTKEAIEKYNRLVVKGEN